MTLLGYVIRARIVFDDLKILCNIVITKKSLNYDNITHSTYDLMRLTINPLNPRPCHYVEEGRWIMNRGYIRNGKINIADDFFSYLYSLSLGDLGLNLNACD